MTPKNQKTLGRSPGSLNAPIAAFTMAVVLCSYCVYSIRSARREAAQSSSPSSSSSSSSSVVLPSQQQQSWVQRALEEKGAGRSK